MKSKVYSYENFFKKSWNYTCHPNNQDDVEGGGGIFKKFWHDGFHSCKNNEKKILNREINFKKIFGEKIDFHEKIHTY